MNPWKELWVGAGGNAVTWEATPNVVLTVFFPATHPGPAHAGFWALGSHRRRGTLLITCPLNWEFL